MKRWTLLLALGLLSAAPASAQEAGWLGLSVRDAAPGGVDVQSVEPESPADRAGLEAGDAVIVYDGIEVVGARQFARLVSETPVGRRVQLRLRREGSERTVELTLGTRPARPVSHIPLPDGIPDWNEIGAHVRDAVREAVASVHVTRSVSRAGIRVDRMTVQLREFFGAPADTGVLVTSVEAGSPAAAAGLRAGDVIVGLEDEVVRSPSDLSRSRLFDGSRVRVTLLRDRSPLDITLLLGTE